MSRRVKYGCLGAAVVVMVGLGTWAYFGFIRPAQAILDDVDLIVDLQTFNRNLRDQETYQPPVDGLLTEDQLERFARVQEGMKAGLGSQYGVLEERALLIRGLLRTESGEVERGRRGLQDVVRALDGLGPVLTEAKELQVAALNEEAFSLSEYRWVRETVYHALGFSRYNVYLEDFAASMKKGDDAKIVAFLEEEPGGDEPLPGNEDLCSLYSGQARSWNPFREFGL